jgi:hypothetical protein
MSSQIDLALNKALDKKPMHLIDKGDHPTQNTKPSKLLTLPTRPTLI